MSRFHRPIIAALLLGCGTWGRAAEDYPILWEHQGRTVDKLGAGFSPDNKLLVVCHRDAVELFDATNGRLKPLPDPPEGFRADHRYFEVAFDPTGKFFAATSWRNKLVLFDIERNQFSRILADQEITKHPIYDPGSPYLELRVQFELRILDDSEKRSHAVFEFPGGNGLPKVRRKAYVSLLEKGHSDVYLDARIAAMKLEAAGMKKYHGGQYTISSDRKTVVIQVADHHVNEFLFYDMPTKELIARFKFPSRRSYDNENGNRTFMFSPDLSRIVRFEQTRKTIVHDLSAIIERRVTNKESVNIGLTP